MKTLIDITVAQPDTDFSINGEVFMYKLDETKTMACLYSRSELQATIFSKVFYIYDEHFAISTGVLFLIQQIQCSLKGKG